MRRRRVAGAVERSRAARAAGAGRGRSRGTGRRRRGTRRPDDDRRPVEVGVERSPVEPAVLVGEPQPRQDRHRHRSPAERSPCTARACAWRSLALLPRGAGSPARPRTRGDRAADPDAGGEDVHRSQHRQHAAHSPGSPVGVHGLRSHLAWRRAHAIASARGPERLDPRAAPAQCVRARGHARALLDP